VPTRRPFRRDTAANWAAADDVLGAGEVGLESDTQRLKIGDGSTPWVSLPYARPLGDNIPPGEWPKAAVRALLLTAVSIALHELRRVMGRRALRAEPRVTLGVNAAWALASIVYTLRKLRARRPARRH
jgi:hypothetical protein